MRDLQAPTLHNIMMKKLLRLFALSLLSVGSATSFVNIASAQTARTGFFMETSKFRHQINPALLEDNPYFSIPFLGNV